MSKAAQPASPSNPAEAAGMVDLVDERGVPISAGIPPIVRISAVIGLIVIFIVVGMVIGSSDAHHVWPSPSSLKIDLANPPQK